MERILSFISCNIDKFLHYFVGYFICSLFVDVHNGLIAASFLALAKELYDYKHKDCHSSDLADFLATVAGAGSYIVLGGIVVI